MQKFMTHYDSIFLNFSSKIILAPDSEKRLQTVLQLV